jgi:nucleoid DNA-binding protein
MLDYITAYLIQAKECSLPGIGYFKINSHPAASDGINKTILPPYNEIIFSENKEQESDPGLLKYIGAKLNLEEKDAEKKLKIFCISLNNKLSLDRMVVLPSLGKLHKDGNGNITFHQEESIKLNEPLIAEKVVHENVSHVVTVGDKEISSDKITPQLLLEDKPKKQWWKVAALILFIFALVIILLQFYNHGLATGDQSPVSPITPTATYK